MIPSNSFLQQIPTRDIVNQMAAIVQILLRGGSFGMGRKGNAGWFYSTTPGPPIQDTTFILKLRWLYFSMSIILIS